MNGFRQARGKYITFLDDDDYYTDYEFFEKAVKILEEHETDEVPIVMVCANAKLVDTQTGKADLWDIGAPGRVKGLDYVLGRGHRKPPSIFPAVFRADVLRQAGLENKIIFDTMTYIEAALDDDAWFMPSIIGVYRVQPYSTERGYKTTTPEQEMRHYRLFGENIRRWKHAAEIIQSRTDKHTAEKLYISTMLGLIGYCTIARPGIKDELKTCMYVLKDSGFMPKLWLAVVRNFIRSSLRRITPLRKLYRFIKYKILRRPYPKS